MKYVLKETIINGTRYRCDCGGTACPIACPTAKIENIDRNYARVDLPMEDFKLPRSKRNNGHPASPRRIKRK